VLPALAWHLGEPFADSSAVPTYYVARMARQHVTVALNGDGGDESFGGYRRYQAHAALSRLAALPRPLRSALRHASAMLPRAAVSRSRLYDLRRFLEGAGQPPAERYAAWFGFFPDPRTVTTRDFARTVTAQDPLGPLRDAFERHRHLAPAAAAMAADVAVYLPDDLLVKADIAAMAHGLEGRSPLLDHHVMEFAARLPLGLKIRAGRGKHLLRQLAKPLLPPGVLDRPKAGFAVPLDRWLRGELAPVMREIVLSRRSIERGIVEAAAARRLIDEHTSGRRSHAHRLWALLMLELWFRSCVDAVPTMRRSDVAGSRAG
jgi:asparagine synthase (glutamine-hydrolysing)